jgi:hypothetical protein
MAVSHSFTGEHVENGRGKETDAERHHHNIKHGINPRVYPFSGVSDGAESGSGLAGLLQVHPWALKFEKHWCSPP